MRQTVFRAYVSRECDPVLPQRSPWTLRQNVAKALGLPVSWLPLTASPLATDAARIMSKLDAFSREAS